MRWTLLTGISFFLLIFSLCTQPPEINYGNYNNLTDSLFNFNSPGKIKGGGRVAISINGESFHGTMYLSLTENRSFHADMYSSLGTVVASIEGDSAKGIVNFNGKEYIFPVDSAVDSLPFSWAKHMAFREFIQFLTADLSSIAGELRKKPASVTTAGQFSTALWNLSDTIITVVIKRSALKAEKLTIKNNQENWVLIFSKFKKGIAQSILFKDDEKNYFSIEYENLKYF